MIQRPGGSILEYIELKLRRDGRRKQDVWYGSKKKTRPLEASTSIFSSFIFVRIGLVPQKGALSSQNPNSTCDAGLPGDFAAFLMVVTGTTRTLVHKSGQ